MQWYKNWRENYKKKEKQQDLINRRGQIETNLLVGLETEESIKMFEEVSVLFRGTMEKRLKRVTEEKSNIEKFLENGKDI
jgi:hypothetical protein